MRPATLRQLMTFYKSRSPLKILLSTSLLFISIHAAIADPDEDSTKNTPFRKWDESKYISKNIRVYISPKGQNYFRENLQDFLFRNGVEIDRGTVNGPQSFDAALPFPLSKLPLEIKKYQKIVNEITDGLLTLFNIKVKEPKFKGSIEKIQYRIGFSRLGAELKPDGDLQLNVAIDKILVQGTELTINEAANPALKIGVKAPIVKFTLDPKMNSAGVLTLNSNVKFSIDERGFPDVRVAVPIVDSTGIEPFLSVGTPLTLPKIGKISAEATITGLDGSTSVLKLNSLEIQKIVDEKRAELERTLLLQTPKLKSALFKLGLEKILEILPFEIEKQLQRVILSARDAVTTIDPPGGPAVVPPEEQFIWNAIPTRVFPEGGILNLELKTITEDQKSDIPNLPSYQKFSGLPMGTAERKDILTSEVAIELHQNFVNRLLHLSFERGYFEKISTGDETFKILEPPIAKIQGAYGLNRLRIGLYVEQKVSGIQRVLVKDPIRLRFDGFIKLVPSKKGGIEVVFTAIDLNTVVIDRDRIKAFPGLVHRKVVQLLEETNKGLLDKPEVLAENVALPDTLFGIPLKLKSFKTSQLGSIFMFLEYGI